MVCYPWSRDPRNCEGPQDGCYRQRRGLTDAEEIRRDKFEEAQLNAGTSLGCQRTTRQADSAAADATEASPASAPRSRDSSKSHGTNRGKGKRERRTVQYLHRDRILLAGRRLL
eukprot:9492556-Pyramimonas_sp.AAC.1